MSIGRWFGLQHTVCVVVGASGLIGNAVVNALADAGAKIICLDLSHEKIRRPASCSEIKIDFDITSEDSVENFFERQLLSKEFFGLARNVVDSASSWAFVNCSYPRTANWPKLGFENVTLDNWNQNVELHLGSTFHFTKKAVLFLKQHNVGGSIVNFASIYGLVGPDNEIYKNTGMQNAVPYAAIKSGIIGLTRYVATAYGSYGIRANVVCPGGVYDNQPKAFVEAYKNKTPMRRMAQPDDIGGAVAFLVGPSAQYVTGQSLVIDGGFTAW